MGKSSLVAIPRDHFATLKDVRTGSVLWGDVLFQAGLPLLLGVASGVLGWKLKSATDLITGVSIVAALLFSMAVFLFQLRIDMSNDKRLSAVDFELADESFHNVLWAILVGFTLVILLVISGAAGWLTARYWGRLITAVTVVLSSHFLVVIAMCLKRVRRAFERVAMRKE
jgi:hypothetical protein